MKVAYVSMSGSQLSIFVIKLLMVQTSYKTLEML
jgi:hypothetical protein